MTWKNPIDMFWTSSVEPRIFLLYFLVQVGQGLPWAALSLLLTRDVGLDYNQMNSYYAICYLPWSFKLVFGYISDSLPIYTHRRIPYFIFYSILVAIIFCVYGFVVRSYVTALVMGIILNTAQCGAQLMIDTLVVERVHKETDDEGRGQSLAMASKTAGTVLATILSLILMLEPISVAYHWFFVLAGIPYLIAAIVAIRIPDRCVTKYSFVETITEGCKLIFCGKRGDSMMSSNKPLFPLLLFLLLRSTMPSTATNVYTYLSMNVSVEAWQYNVLNISTSIASLIASFVYNRWMIGKNLAVIIVWTTFGACITSLAQIYFVTGLFEDKNVLFWVTIVIMDINAFASQLAFIPMLIMVTRACPAGYEASMWAVFFSINDLAGSLGGTLSTKLTEYYNISVTDWSNLYRYVVTCSLISLAPLLYLFIIRDYFDIVSNMSDNTAEVRGGLSLIVNDEMQIMDQKRVYN